MALLHGSKISFRVNKLEAYVLMLLATIAFCKTQQAQETTPSGGSGTGRPIASQWGEFVGELVNGEPTKPFPFTAVGSDGRQFHLSFSCGLLAPPINDVLVPSAFLEIHIEGVSFETEPTTTPDTLPFTSWIYAQADGGDTAPRIPSYSSDSRTRSVVVSFPLDRPSLIKQQFADGLLPPVSPVGPYNTGDPRFLSKLFGGFMTANDIDAFDLQTVTLRSLLGSRELTVRVKLTGGDQSTVHIPLGSQPQAFLMGCATHPQLLRAGLRAKQHDLRGALADYQAVLKLNPTDSAAKAGVDEVQAIVNRIAALTAEQAAQGEWWDQRTNLLWTANDNGGDVNFTEAQEYCRSLRNGGFSDWQVPELDQFRTLLRQAGSGGYYVDYSVHLNELEWTNSPDPLRPGNELAFGSTVTMSYPDSQKFHAHATCVRDFVFPASASGRVGVSSVDLAPAPPKTTVELLASGDPGRPFTADELATVLPELLKNAARSHGQSPDAYDKDAAYLGGILKRCSLYTGGLRFSPLDHLGSAFADCNQTGPIDISREAGDVPGQSGGQDLLLKLSFTRDPRYFNNGGPIISLAIGDFRAPLVKEADIQPTEDPKGPQIWEAENGPNRDGGLRVPIIWNYRAGPTWVVQGGRIRVMFNVADAGAPPNSELRAELLRTPDVNGQPGNWETADTKTMTMNPSGASFVFWEQGQEPGRYWYGMRVVDAANRVVREPQPLLVRVASAGEIARAAEDSPGGLFPGGTDVVLGTAVNPPPSAQKAAVAPPVSLPAPLSSGTGGGAGMAAADPRIAIPTAATLIVGMSTCNWRLPQDQNANLNRYLNQARGSMMWGPRVTAAMEDAQDRVRAVGARNYCSPMEKARFDKLAGTVWPKGPIAAPGGNQ